MNLYQNLFCAVIFVQIIIVQVNSNYQRRNRDECCKVVCPDSFLPETFSKNFTLPYAIATMKNQWNKPKPELSCEAQRLKQIILKMLDSNKLCWKTVAYITSVSFWATVDLLSQNIELCTISQMINSSVTWDKEHCCKTLNKAVDSMSFTTFSDRINLMLADSFKSAGCEQPPVLPVTVSCYGNGNVYDLNEFWKTNRNDFPCDFVESILKLAKSKNSIDRYLAQVATVCSSKITQKLMGNFDPSLTLKLFGFQGLPKINKCCCPKLKAELDTLFEMNKCFIRKITASTKRSFNC